MSQTFDIDLHDHFLNQETYIEQTRFLDEVKKQNECQEIDLQQYENQKYIEQFEYLKSIKKN